MTTQPPDALQTLRESLNRMVSAGWIESYSAGPKDKLGIKWTEDGKHTLEAVWCMMQEMGEPEGIQHAWSLLGSLAVERFRE